MKDMFVSSALTARVRAERIELQTGVAYATLRRHYARWVPNPDEDELLMLGSRSRSFSGLVVTPEG